LTYDDALNVHLDKVIPSLDSARLKGTFYLSGYFPGFKDRITDWKKAAQKGHEMANHTLFHPCTGNAPGREWVHAERDLSKYTLSRITDEIRMNNVLLESIDGKKKRTFAYPCGDSKVGDTSYVDNIKGDFVSARGVQGEYVQLGKADLYNVGSFMINGQTGEQMIDMVKKAMEQNNMIVFLFHGVGGEHALNVDLAEHRKLIKFLKSNEKDIWIAPFIEATEYIKNYR
jgi:sialate O-acetylesterase